MLPLLPGIRGLPSPRFALPGECARGGVGGGLVRKGGGEEGGRASRTARATWPTAATTSATVAPSATGAACACTGAGSCMVEASGCRWAGGDPTQQDRQVTAAGMDATPGRRPASRSSFSRRPPSTHAADLQVCSGSFQARFHTRATPFRTNGTQPGLEPGIIRARMGGPNKVFLLRAGWVVMHRCGAREVQ